MPNSGTGQRPSLDRRLIAEAGIARGALFVSVSLTFGAALAVIAQALLFSRVIDRVFLGGARLDLVAGLLIVLAGVIGLRALLSFGSSAAAARVAIRVKADLRRRFTAQLLALGPAYTQGERSGELTLTATEGIEKLDAYFRDYLPGAISAVLVPVLILLVVVPLDLLTFAVLADHRAAHSTVHGADRHGGGGAGAASVRRDAVSRRALPRRDAGLNHAQIVQPERAAGGNHPADYGRLPRGDDARLTGGVSLGADAGNAGDAERGDCRGRDWRPAD